MKAPTIEKYYFIMGKEGKENNGIDWETQKTIFLFFGIQSPNTIVDIHFDWENHD